MKITDIEIRENNVKSAPDTINTDGAVSAVDVKNIFDKLPELIARKHNELVDYAGSELCTKTELKAAVIQEIMAVGGEEIAKNIYDSDNDGMVDNAKHFSGFDVEHFATKEQADTAQSTADEAKAAADNAMSVNGGTFAGDVLACEQNRDTGSLRNIEIRTGSATGTMQSTNKIIMVRK